MSTSADTMTDFQGTDAAVIEPPRERRVLGLAASTWPKILAPLFIGIVSLTLWEVVVRVNDIPRYILPGPILIGQTLIKDWHTLSVSLWITLQITFLALVVAVALGVALSILFSQSKWIELSFFRRSATIKSRSQSAPPKSSRASGGTEFRARPSSPLTPSPRLRVSA